MQRLLLGLLALGLCRCGSSGSSAIAGDADASDPSDVASDEDAGPSDGADAAVSDGSIATDVGADGPGRWMTRSPCRFPAPQPAARSGFMAATDTHRKKVILYGGGSDNGVVADLWEWDPATGEWTDRTACDGTNVTPGPRTQGGVVYDSARRRFVLFGGDVNGDRTRHVWEWDPATGVWTDRTPAPLPPSWPTVMGQAVFDAARGIAVMVSARGGFPSNLWEWDGTRGTWADRTPADPHWLKDAWAPSLVYDDTRHTVAIFGGTRGSESTDDLLVWDGAAGTLTDLTPQPRPALWPSGRSGAAFVGDPASGRLVLLGGYRHLLGRRDLWEWDPGARTWTNRTPADLGPTSADPWPGGPWPSPIFSQTFLLDPVHARPVSLASNVSFLSWDTTAGRWSVPPLAGPPRWPTALGPLAWDRRLGRAMMTSDGRELWSWSVVLGEWTRAAAADNAAAAWPERRQGHALVQDLSASRLVLFGGQLLEITPTLTADLWLWDADGRAWTNVPPSPAGPAPRSEHALVFDSRRSRVLLFGGFLSEPSDELWELHVASATWRNLTPPTRPSAGMPWPPARGRHAMTYDASRGVLLLFGGEGAGGVPLADLWEWNSTTERWQQRHSSRADAPWPGGQWTQLNFLSESGVLALDQFPAVPAVPFQLLRWNHQDGVWDRMAPPAPQPQDVLGFSRMVAGEDRLIVMHPAGKDRSHEQRSFSEIREWWP